MLEHLGTLTRSDVRVASAPAAAAFPQLSTPTPIQRKAFELIEVPVPLRLA